LGLRCLPSRKAVNLPSWVPDYTTGACELAIQNASYTTSRLVDKKYEISGDCLHLNAHLLDTVEWSHVVEDCGDIENIMNIIFELDEHFKEANGILAEYRAYHEGWIEASSPDEVRRKTMIELSKAESILQDMPGYPKQWLKHLWDGRQQLYQRRDRTPDHRPTMLEALWSLLSPETTMTTRPDGGGS
jgi:hypothetical protein